MSVAQVQVDMMTDGRVETAVSLAVLSTAMSTAPGGGSRNGVLC